MGPKKIDVLSGLAMFQDGERRDSLRPGTRAIVDEALSQPSEVSEAGDGERPARPGQPTNRAEILERAEQLSARSAALADEAEDPRSPCARARERSRALVGHVMTSQQLVVDMVAVLDLAIVKCRGTSPTLADRCTALKERADELSESAIDILGA